MENLGKLLCTRKNENPTPVTSKRIGEKEEEYGLALKTFKDCI